MSTNTVDINTNTNKKTVGQFAIEFQESGYGGMIPVINGTKAEALMFGYVSESDKQAAIDLITQAALATDGDIYAMRSYMMNAVRLAANGIKANETVTILGIELLINYEQKTIYLDTETIATLEDITSDMSNEVIKALLIERATNVLNERLAAFDDDDDLDLSDLIF